MIRATIGRGGSGKSASTVHRLFQRRQRAWAIGEGRGLYSNTPLLDLRVQLKSTPNGIMWCPVNGDTFGMSWADGYVTKFVDIYGLDNADVFLDELGSWMPKKDWNSMPPELVAFLNQDRKEGVDIWWTHRTARVFYEVWDNTAELTRCARYGPIIHSTVSDPQEPAEKPVHRFLTLGPKVYDLYNTYMRIGNANGEGYTDGKRREYRAGGRAPWYWHVELETVSGERLRTRYRLRPEQRACLIRKFGTDALHLTRHEHPLGGVLYSIPREVEPIKPEVVAAIS